MKVAVVTSKYEDSFWATAGVKLEFISNDIAAARKWVRDKNKSRAFRKYSVSVKELLSAGNLPEIKGM